MSLAPLSLIPSPDFSNEELWILLAGLLNAPLRAGDRIELDEPYIVESGQFPFAYGEESVGILDRANRDSKSTLRVCQMSSA